MPSRVLLLRVIVRLAFRTIGAFKREGPAAPVPLLKVIGFDDAPRLPYARIASVTRS